MQFFFPLILCRRLEIWRFQHRCLSQHGSFDGRILLSKTKSHFTSYMSSHGRNKVLRYCHEDTQGIWALTRWQTSVTGKLNSEEFVCLWNKVTTYKVKTKVQGQNQSDLWSHPEFLWTRAAQHWQKRPFPFLGHLLPHWCLQNRNAVAEWATKRLQGYR